MGSHCPGIIRIGGKLKNKDVKKFCKLLSESYVSIEYGNDKDFTPTNKRDLLQGCTDGHLILTNDQASNGRFEMLEEGCRKMGLSYDRHSDPVYEYNAEGSVFRYRGKGKKPFTYQFSAGDGFYDVLVDRGIIELALMSLEQKKVAEAYDILRKVCPLIPPLPMFEVVP